MDCDIVTKTIQLLETKLDVLNLTLRGLTACDCAVNIEERTIFPCFISGAVVHSIYGIKFREGL